MAENNENRIVTATVREGRGKNDSRRVRAAGNIPFTIYGGGGESIAATAKLADLAAVIRSKSGLNSVFNVDINGEQIEVMFHDRQIDPVKGKLIHADLVRVVRGQKIEVTVSLELVGNPLGISEDGGLLEQIMHEIQVRCRPSQIPESIQADVSNLRINEILHVSDIKAEEGIEFVDDGTGVVASIKFAKTEEEEGISPSDTAATEPAKTE